MPFFIFKNTAFVEDYGVFACFIYLFVFWRAFLLSSSFSFAPFRKIFEKSWIQFHLSPVYLQQSQIYMFSNGNLPLVANIKFVGDCVAKSWQLRKDHSGTGVLE